VCNPHSRISPLIIHFAYFHFFSVNPPVKMRAIFFFSFEKPRMEAAHFLISQLCLLLYSLDGCAVTSDGVLVLLPYASGDFIFRRASTEPIVVKGEAFFAAVPVPARFFFTRLSFFNCGGFPPLTCSRSFLPVGPVCDLRVFFPPAPLKLPLRQNLPQSQGTNLFFLVTIR